MLMVGRKILLLSFWKCMCFILSAITVVGHLGAKVGKNTLSSAPSVKRGGKMHIIGCLRGGPVVARLGHHLSPPGWSGGLLKAPDPRGSWAGVLCASGRGRVVPSVSALHLADPQEVGAQGWLALAQLSAELAQAKGDWKQQKSWCA